MNKGFATVVNDIYKHDKNRFGYIFLINSLSTAPYIKIVPGGRGDRDGEDMWTQGLFISMYDKIHYKKKKKKNSSTKFNMKSHREEL